VLKSQACDEQAHGKADTAGECGSQQLQPIDAFGEAGQPTCHAQTDKEQNTDRFADHQSQRDAKGYRVGDVKPRNIAQR
jgi:hypothetical protein